jgi:hypothetical protein
MKTSVTKRVDMRLDVEVLAQIEEWQRVLGCSRTGFIELAVRERLERLGHAVENALEVPSATPKPAQSARPDVARTIGARALTDPMGRPIAPLEKLRGRVKPGG